MKALGGNKTFFPHIEL